jgi:hypothetical protein
MAAVANGPWRYLNKKMETKPSADDYPEMGTILI